MRALIDMEKLEIESCQKREWVEPLGELELGDFVAFRYIAISRIQINLMSE